jgi:hypothetical protein
MSGRNGAPSLLLCRGRSAEALGEPTPDQRMKVGGQQSFIRKIL